MNGSLLRARVGVLKCSKLARAHGVLWNQRQSVGDRAFLHRHHRDRLGSKVRRILMCASIRIRMATLEITNKINMGIEILPHHLLGSRDMDIMAASSSSSSKSDDKITMEVSSRVDTGIRTNKHHRRTDLPISTNLLSNNRATIFAMPLKHPTSNSDTVGTSRVASNSLVLALTL
jgi:hypothetical protein